MNASITPSARFGDLLVAQGMIERAVLEKAAHNAKSLIGEYLRANNIISAKMVAKTLALQQRLPFVDFNVSPPTESLFCPGHMQHYQTHRYVPYAQDSQGMTIATPEPNAELHKLLAEYYGTSIRMVATGSYDLAQYFSTIAATRSHRAAMLALRRQYKHLTADRVLTTRQSNTLCMLLLLTLTALVWRPDLLLESLLFICNMFYFLSLYTKRILLKHGLNRLQAQQQQLEKLLEAVAQLRDEDLPIYSILVPLYKERSQVMQRLIHHLSALNYPPEKLDIQLICEADDAETIDTLKSLHPPHNMKIIYVPPGHPRTKPKACNVALTQTRGEFLVIYDAEDQPEPDQLKRAVVTFAKLPLHIACLQASLNYYNRFENLLTAFFSIEYSALFRLNLPALSHLKSPIPLGGTSNHFRIAILREIGGWDPFNVTEDADLGIRLAYFGYETAMLDSHTYEEAPLTLRAWLKQRTRWIKGHMQTWLVYMRDRNLVKKRLGTQGYYGLQLFLGLPVLVFLLGPVFWILFAFSLLDSSTDSSYSLNDYLCALSLLGGIVSSVVVARTTLRIEKWAKMRYAAWLYPAYWVLHSFAALAALVQLVRNPHYWSKTTHGLSKYKHTA